MPRPTFQRRSKRVRLCPCPPKECMCMCEWAYVSVHRACERGVCECDTGRCQACMCPHPYTKHQRSRLPPVLSALTIPSASISTEPLSDTASSSQCQGEQLYSSPQVGPFLMFLAPTFQGKSVPSASVHSLLFPPHYFSRCQREVYKAPSSCSRNGS